MKEEQHAIYPPFQNHYQQDGPKIKEQMQYSPEWLTQVQQHKTKSINKYLQQYYSLSQPQLQQLFNVVFQELQLKYDKQSKKDYQEIKMLICYVGYPLTGLAVMHIMANWLNQCHLTNSIKSHIDSQPTNLSSQQVDRITRISNSPVCPCCQHIIHPHGLSILTSVEQINHIGVATVQFFHTLKLMILLLLVMCAVFAIYAIATNFIIAAKSQTVFMTAAKTTSSVGAVLQFFHSKLLQMSIGSIIQSFEKSKQADSTANPPAYIIYSFIIQSWLAVIAILVWIIVLIIWKIVQYRKIAILKNYMKSQANFTLVFEDMPVYTLKQDKTIREFLLQLQSQLEQYRIDQAPNSKLSQQTASVPIKFKQVFFPSHPTQQHEQTFKLDEEFQKIQEKLVQIKEQFKNWIIQRQKKQQFSVPAWERQQRYQQFQQLFKDKQQIKGKLQSQKIEQVINNRKKYVDELNVYVTFEYAQNKQFLQQSNRKLDKFPHNLPCYSKTNFFSISTASKRFFPKITAAPQPQDLKWVPLQNKCETYLQRFFIFVISVIIICLSFQ